MQVGDAGSVLADEAGSRCLPVVEVVLEGGGGLGEVGVWWVWVGNAGSVLADGSGSRHIAGIWGVVCCCRAVGGKVRGE